MNSSLLLTLRRLRAPIILLIVIYAVGMMGLVLIPGVDENGQPWHMTLFQAFYFTSYTASTIGFGEIPHAFTDQPAAVGDGHHLRVGDRLGLPAREPARRSAATRPCARRSSEKRFRQRVEALVEPFYLICGFGETGQLIARALDLRGRRFVVDRDRRDPRAGSRPDGLPPGAARARGRRAPAGRTSRPPDCARTSAAACWRSPTTTAPTSPWRWPCACWSRTCRCWRAP